MVAIFQKFLFFSMACMLAACTTAQFGDGNNSTGFTQHGLASYYGDKHQNRKTANGETYQHHLNTAAHKRLAFGSTVKVTNVNNGKSVIVKINDRGPFVKGRIIDLSKSAFSKISHTSTGLLKVKIEVIQ